MNADSEPVTALVFAVLREYGLEPDPAHTDADLKDIEGIYARRGGSFDVLESADGRIIGCVAVFAMGDGVCELRKMYLHPDHRGRGLGQRLLVHAIGRARGLGFRRITLETHAVLREAIALYTRNGFKPFESDHLSSRCDQAFYLDLES